MKREFLDSLGIEKDMIEKIMSEHGKTVQDLNDRMSEKDTVIKGLNDQISNRDADIKKLQDNTDNEDFKAKYSALQDKYDNDKQVLEKQLQETRLNSAINLELVKRKAYNNKTVLPLIDMETVKLTDEGLSGLNEQLDKIGKENSYLFKQEEDKDKSGAPNMSADKNPSRKRSTKADALRQELGITSKGD